MDKRQAEQAGIAKTDDFKAGDNAGNGYFHVNQKMGRRWSAARGFLKPVLKRANLRLETGVKVERVLFEGNKAVGVEFVRDGQRMTASADGEVILSAGSIASPVILAASGIGDQARLNEPGPALTHTPAPPTPY